jgi:hypothetical protein
MDLRKLWKTTISALLPPENPCGAMIPSPSSSPLAVARISQGFPGFPRIIDHLIEAEIMEAEIMEAEII